MHHMQKRNRIFYTFLIGFVVTTPLFTLAHAPQLHSETVALVTTLKHAQEKQNREYAPLDVFISIDKTLGELIDPLFLPFTIQDDERKMEEFKDEPIRKKIEIMQERSAEDPERAWEFLKHASTNEAGESLFDAHELSHIVGNTLYDQRGFSGIEACDEAFGYGCYHGVNEKMFYENGSDALTEMEELCNELFRHDEQFSQEYVACIHGAGHGLLTYHVYDLEKSLEDCNRFELAHDCVSGVFMEYAFGAPIGKKFYDQPWDLCTTIVSDANRMMCGGAVSAITQFHFETFTTHAFSEQTSIGANVTICKSAPDTLTRDGCIWGLAGLFTLISPQNPGAISQMCDEFSSIETRDLCLTESAKKLAYRDFINWEENVATLCERSDEDLEDCVQSARESRGVHTTLRSMLSR